MRRHSDAKGFLISIVKAVVGKTPTTAFTFATIAKPMATTRELLISLWHGKIFFD